MITEEELYKMVAGSNGEWYANIAANVGKEIFGELPWCAAMWTTNSNKRMVEDPRFQERLALALLTR